VRARTETQSENMQCSSTPNTKPGMQWHQTKTERRETQSKLHEHVM